MGGFRKFLVIYIALVVTVTAALLLYEVRIASENTKKFILSADKIEKGLEKLEEYQQSSKQVLEELEKLKKDPDTPTQQVLGQTQQASESSQVSLGFVTISDKKWESVYIYEDSSLSSKIIGKAEFGKAYRYFKKEDGWYQIMMPKTENMGWVSSKFFKELSDNMP